MSALIPVSLIPQAMPRTATANGAETARAFAPSVLIGLLRNPEFKAMIASGINLEESTFAIQGVNVSSNARGEQGIYIEFNATGQTKRAGAKGHQLYISCRCLGPTPAGQHKLARP